MIYKQLNSSLYWTGILDKELRVFDIIMHTEFGTTYNSYILKGSEKTALFETAKGKFADDYLDTVRQIVPLESIEYVIVDHTEPDHAGSLERILELNPSVKIVASGTAIDFLKNIVNRDFYAIPVSDGDTLSLGDKTLRFFSVPNLHWPDTIYTYIEEDRVLVTCDSFGSHYAHDGILRSSVTDYEGYMRATKYYFDNILGPFAQPYMTDALKLVRDELKPVMICPGHGPVLDSDLEDLYEKYALWCGMDAPDADDTSKNKKVVIPYVSAYGYTGDLAERIAEGIRSMGAFDVALYDMVTSDKAEVLAAIGAADGILFGSPTILQEALNPIWDLTINMYPPIHGGKYASAFGTYGWSGEAVSHLTERLRQIGLKVMEGFRVRLKPDRIDLIDAFSFGCAFAAFMTRPAAAAPASVSSGLVKCAVCGAVFDASVTVCPTCGVGPESFIPVSEEKVEFRNDTDNVYVILGSGTAALNAAEAIRERDASGRILMITEETELPYNRPMLTKNMFAGPEPKIFRIHDREWFDERNIELLMGRTVASLDPEERTIALADGETVSYDKCIYALGAHFFVPPFEGHKDERVTTIRTLSDIEKVQTLLGPDKQAVVIGGGVVGLEAAWELRKFGCDVTILEAMPSLMSNKLDKTASLLLQDIFEDKGVHIIANAQTERFADKQIFLKDGAAIPADVVVVSCGVRANVSVAQAAGAAVGRAIIVNSKMETGIPNVYAVGDCAEFEGMNYALWPEASDQGKTAGANACGDDLCYSSQIFGMTMHVAGTELYAIGKTSGNDPFRTVEFLDPARKTLKKYFFLNDLLCGVTLIGDTSDMIKVTDLVNRRVPYGEIF
ncbi:MAG: FAD-dependent oxidoreductase [Eubacteriales bacterium]|nr:FAD-dependent oxidoreductase [Eubacteriales bacterium]